MKNITYLLEDNPNVNNDILVRKEFQLFKKNINLLDKIHKRREDDKKNNIIPRFILEDCFKKNNYLELKSFQLFTNNYLNPNTPYSRLLLKWETGLGKTIGALSIALNFINYYQKEKLIYGNTNIEFGSVFILGFTKSIFQNELLRFPEFGFISRTELEKLNKLKKKSYSGNPIDIEKLKKFMMVIRKRIYNRKGNGFFKFMGYKELTNHLFINNTNKKIIINKLSDDQLKDKIKNKEISLNKDLLNSFSNSLIICDEIHNVYNSIEKNNWGIALQVILNYHPSCRAVFLSATPLNNSPSETIDLLNLLLPRQLYPIIKKQDFFDDNNNLLKHKKELMVSLLHGRVSFIRDSNPRYFAKKNMIGETLPNSNGIKFVRSPMSNFHYKTFKEVMINNNEKLPQDGSYLTDFVLPDPSSNKPYDTLGIYKTNMVKSKLANATQQWKNKFNIYYDPKRDIITGDALNIKNKLNLISSKYFKMIKNIHTKLSNKKGKIFIYHNFIHMSGTFFIKEVLNKNGFIGEFASSSNNTLCSICGSPRNTHTKNQLIRSFGGSVNDKQFINNEQKFIIQRINNRFEVSAGEKILEFFLFDDNIIFHLYNNLDIHKLSEQTINNIIYFIDNFNNLFDTKNEPYNLDLSNEKNIIFQIYDNNITFNNNKLLSLIIKKYNIFKYKNYLYIFKKKSTFANLSKREMIEFTQKLDNYLSQPIYGGEFHMFEPARYVIVHSNLDKKTILKSMEKFNNTNNIYGNRFMIIIGSQLIKESYSMNSVRNIMVMSRPNNISTLIQILGRVVRFGSHKLLPEEQQNVDIELHTMCEPVMHNNKYKLSYEEKKYVEKIKTHKIIQEIEKIIHENAIDSYFNYDSVWKYQDPSNLNGINILPYEPNVSKNVKKISNIDDLNLSTFNAYYAKYEVDYIIYIIKRLFIEISPVWKYDDLFNAVKMPTFEVEIDLSLISKELYNIALTNLLFKNDVRFVETSIQNLHNNIDEDLVDILKNPLDKLLRFNDNIYAITQIHDYYVLSKLTKNMEIELDIDSIFRESKFNKSQTINIIDFLKYDLVNNYEDKKLRFFQKWKRVDISNLELALCDFGTTFHIRFIEDCIKYIFEMWVDVNHKKSEYHSIYLKFLYYYDLQNLVIWAHTTTQQMSKKYEKYVNPVNLTNNKTSNIGFTNLLKSSLTKSNVNWVSTGMKNTYNEKLEKTLSLYDGLTKKNKTFKKIPANNLPVGHFIDNIPRFYLPELGGWIDDPNYAETNIKFNENKIIVGYDDRSQTGINIKFKIRNPIQNIRKFTDSRMIEKGSVCTTKSKPYLKNLLEKLGVNTKNKKLSVFEMCDLIRNRLIYFELKEQEKNIPEDKKEKYFYYMFQKRPELNI